MDSPELVVFRKHSAYVAGLAGTLGNGFAEKLHAKGIISQAVRNKCTSKSAGLTSAEIGSELVKAMEVRLEFAVNDQRRKELFDLILQQMCQVPLISLANAMRSDYIKEVAMQKEKGNLGQASAQVKEPDGGNASGHSFNISNINAPVNIIQGHSNETNIMTTTHATGTSTGEGDAQMTQTSKTTDTAQAKTTGTTTAPDTTNTNTGGGVKEADTPPKVIELPCVETNPLSSLVSINESLSYQYDEKSLLGSGASSTVYKGTFRGEDVAVKRMNKKLSDDYKNLLLNIKHENIVPVLCIERFIDLDYIVLELCLASFHQYFKKLEEVMNKFEGLTVVKKDVNQDVVRGLEYLHEQNIVHRDIKPGNILLIQKSSSSEVKAVLADFGLSTKLDDDRFSKTTVDARGTKLWMAPELLVEDGKKLRFSRESDIFSMGCVIYFVETDGKHAFDTGDSSDPVILQNLKTYNPCDFCLLDGKQIASALIKKMIKHDRDSRPSASEVLQDPYFKDDTQDIIQVPQPQLTKGKEALQPQDDIPPQDTSEVHDRASISSPEQSVSADGKGHASIPPPEQSVTDTSYGEQLYDVMSDMSHSLPQYIVDHYIRLLAIVNVKCDMKRDWPLSKRFLELYSIHTSHMSPQVAASYVYKILTGLGYEEMEDFRVYLHTKVDIDTKITEELEEITEFRAAVTEVVNDELGPRLGDYQKDRYRMVLTVLCITTFDSKKSFFELFTDLTRKLGKYPLAVSLTIGVLERSGWGDTKKLKPFLLPNFDINTAYPKVDLCLTVADYYGNMVQSDFSSAKIYTSVLHLNSHNVSNMSRFQFTLLLIECGVVKAGDVSKIEDKHQYSIILKEYEKRCKGPSMETAPTTDETAIPSLPTQHTVPIQETKVQATSALSETFIPTKQQLSPTEVSKNLKAADQEFPFPHNLFKDIKIVLMTASEEELDGVYKYLDPLDDQKKIVEYFIPHAGKEKEKVYIGKYGQHPVVVGMSAPAKDKQGPLAATHVARSIIEAVEPDYVIAIGICYGMDKSKSSLCDIAVSSMVCDFTCLKQSVGSEEQDKTKIKLEPRGNMPSVGTTLLNVFFPSFDFKMLRCPHSNDTKEIKVHCGPFIARPDLINDPKYKEELKRLRSDAIAGEMEGAGIMAAVQNATGVTAIIIKAISDWADGTKDDTRNWKPFACDAAAKYVHHQMNKKNNAF